MHALKHKIYLNFIAMITILFLLLFDNCVCVCVCIPLNSDHQKMMTFRGVCFDRVDYFWYAIAIDLFLFMM